MSGGSLGAPVRPADLTEPKPSPFAGLTVAIADSPNPLRSRRLRQWMASRPRRDHLYVTFLKELGCDAIYVHDGDPAGLAADLLILYGNSRSFYKYAGQLRARPHDRPRVAIWQIDPLPPLEFDRRLEKRALALGSLFSRSRLLRPIEIIAGLGLYHTIAKRGFGVYSDPPSGKLVDAFMARTVVEAYAFIGRSLDEGWADAIVAATTGRQRFLASRGINSLRASASFHERVGEDRNLPREVDVLFIGKLNKRSRRRRLGVMMQDLEKRGIRTVVVERGCYGEARTALLNRTKIVLHLHKYPWDTPWMRWAMAAACGVPVVSEPLSDPEPFEPGVHYVEASFEELPATIEHLLHQSERRSAIARQCLNLVREKANVRISLETICRTLLAGEPAGVSHRHG